MRARPFSIIENSDGANQIRGFPIEHDLVSINKM